MLRERVLIENKIENKMQIYLSLIVCCILSWHGLKKKSLSADGAISAFMLGFIIFTHSDLLWSLVLLSFYLSGSTVTKFGSDRKKRYEEEYLDGGQRTSIQVWANGLTGAILSIIDRRSMHNDRCYHSLNHWILITAYVAHFACCNGDTWASEIGILSSKRPILITTLKEVPRGTNGGISILGLLASILGGSFIGLVAAITLILRIECDYRYYNGVVLVCIGGLSGFVGSLIDSFLGALFQKSMINTKTGKVTTDFQDEFKDLKHISGLAILDNHQVNFISSLLTSMLASITMYLLQK